MPRLYVSLMFRFVEDAIAPCKVVPHSLLLTSIPNLSCEMLAVQMPDFLKKSGI